MATLSHLSDTNLYGMVRVVLSVSEETPIGTLWTSMAVIVPAYSHKDAEAVVKRLFKKSVLEDDRVRIEYFDIETLSSSYGDPVYAAGEFNVRLPENVVRLVQHEYERKHAAEVRDLVEELDSQ